MSQPNEISAQEDLTTASPSVMAQMRIHLRPLLLGTLLLTLLTGMGFPLLLAAFAWPLFPHQSSGSLVSRNGNVVGSELIGQNFSQAGYFHSRPSAAGDGYDATASGGTNLGPANPKLRNGARDAPATPGAGGTFAGVRELADAYRLQNGLGANVPVPVDAVTRSGSGLDPHISPANAALQVGRVARARQQSEEKIRNLVAEHTHGRQLGFLGGPQVDVLALNIALDSSAPLPTLAPNR